MKKLDPNFIQFAYKATYVFVLVLISLGVTATLLGYLTQREISKRTYSVQGHASENFTPDTAEINLGVTLYGDNVIELQKKASEAYQEAIDAIKTAGIDEKDIKTQQYTIQETYRGLGDDVKPTNEVSLSLVITIRDTKPESKLISETINAGTEAGFNKVNSLRFYIDDLLAAQDSIKELAIKDAKERAKTESNLAGLKLGKVINVYSNDYYPGNYQEQGVNTMQKLDALDSVAPIIPSVDILPGEQEISVDVTLEFELR